MRVDCWVTDSFLLQDWHRWGVALPWAIKATVYQPQRRQVYVRKVRWLRGRAHPTETRYHEVHFFPIKAARLTFMICKISKKMTKASTVTTSFCYKMFSSTKRWIFYSNYSESSIRSWLLCWIQVRSNMKICWNS